MQPARHPFPSLVLATHEYAPFRGGVATYVLELAIAARDLGHPVEVWTVDYHHRSSTLPPSAVGSPAPSSLVPTVRLASNGRLTPGGILSLAWSLARRRCTLRRCPIIALSVGAQMALFLLDACGILRASQVTVFFHGSELLRFKRQRLWRWLAKRFYARTAGFGVVTPAVAQLARTSGLLPVDAHIAVAPAALPAAFATRPADDQPAAKFHVELSSEEVWSVLTVARLHPRKGQVEVARALTLLPAAQRARVVYRLVGVGDESYRRQIEATCAEGGVRCVFLGAVPDEALGGVYREATLYAQASVTLPQSVEGFGISFLEASFYGLPIAAYRTGGVDAAVLDGVTGLLSPEGDPAGLARHIERLLADAALRQRLGDAGRRHAQSFRWEDSARTLCGMAVAAWTEEGETR